MEMIAQMQTVQYGDGFFNRLDPRVKIGVVFLSSLIGPLIEQPAALAILSLVACGYLLTAGLKKTLLYVAGFYTLSMALALQHPDLQLFASTVLEEVQDVGEAGEKWLERFDLWPLRHRHPLTLSGGEMQRLVLAIAFATLSRKEPGLLLLDEPTSGMDGHHLRILGKEIHKLRKQKYGVVMATHDPDLVKLSGATPTEFIRK